MRPAWRYWVAALLAAGPAACDAPVDTGAMPVGTAAPRATHGDAALADAYADRRGNVQVEGRGTVVRVLADDDDGSRHQRFILRLSSGQTVLVAHNIDLSARLHGLRAGDVVAFRGEYEWNPQGGVVHWTHADPQGRHPAGWVRVVDAAH